MEVNAECKENKRNFTQEMSISNIFKHPRFVEEYQKTNPAKWITVPIEEMSIIYRILNEGLPDGQGNTIAELKNRIITGRPNHESIWQYTMLIKGRLSFLLYNNYCGT